MAVQRRQWDETTLKVTPRKKGQPALLELPHEVSNRGGFRAQGKAMTRIGYWGEISPWFHWEGFFGGFLFDERAMLLATCGI